jgi:hypothetical protein
MLDPKEIEATYKEITFGYDEPELIYASGQEHKRMASLCGVELTHDRDGNPILDGECYGLTKDGLFLVLDA